MNSLTPFIRRTGQPRCFFRTGKQLLPLRPPLGQSRRLCHPAARRLPPLGAAAIRNRRARGATDTGTRRVFP